MHNLYYGVQSALVDETMIKFCNFQAGLIEEMMEDTFEGLEDDDLEEQADEEVEKILFEITSGKRNSPIKLITLVCCQVPHWRSGCIAQISSSASARACGLSECLVCIIILPNLIGQLGKLGPVKSTLPEQEVAGVRSQCCEYLPFLQYTHTHTHTHTHACTLILANLHERLLSLSLIVNTYTLSHHPHILPLQAVGPEPEEEEEEEEDLTERLQALRS